jgi:acetolactate synthase-1/2/3 large subunit
LPKPANVKLVQVDIDPAELHKNYPADLVILSDIELFLRALLQQAPQQLSSWRKGMATDVAAEIKELKRKWLDSWNPRLTSDEIPMNPYRACWDITHQLDRHKTILLHDAGVTRAYVSHHYEALNPLGFIGFGGTSAMGWSTPAAMGAKLGNPAKTVVNFTGDGSFGMTGMEIETAARNDIRTLTVFSTMKAWREPRNPARALQSDMRSAFLRVITPVSHEHLALTESVSRSRPI